ncbi:MAG: S9 family peptidase [Methanosarcinaceae archaeon]
MKDEALKKLFFLNFVSFILLIILLDLPPVLYSQKLLTINTLLKARQVQSKMSCQPEGSHVVFTVRQADLKQSRYYRSIWVQETAAPAPQPLKTGLDDAFAPQWSPAPETPYIAFLGRSLADTNQSQISQLFIISTTGEPPQCLSQAIFGVTEFKWSPDGRSIAWLTRETPSPEKLVELRNKQSAKIDAYAYEKPLFKKEIRMFDLTSRLNERIFTGDFGIKNIAFSPDGEMLTFCSNRSGLDDDPEYDLWLLSLGTQQVFQLTNSPGAEQAPQFSPDGQNIAYLSHSVPGESFFQTDIAVIPVTGGTPQNLTGNFDHNITTFQWAPDGKKIYFEAQSGIQNFFYQYSYAGKKCTPFFESPQNGFYRDLISTRDDKQFFFCREDAASLPEIFWWSGKSKIRQLTQFTAALDSFHLIKPQTFHWQDENNIKVEGMLLTPIKNQAPPPYPLVLVLHGGPYGRFTDQLIQSDYLQLYAQQGYLVFAPNPAGSVGYGHDFAQSIQNDLGGLDYRQIMAGVNQLIQQELVDTTRMFVAGGSYGGYLTNWIISQTPRFRAAVSMYGIFNLVTDWGSSARPSWQKIYLGDYYWNNFRLYQSRSPSTFVQQIQTPLLLLHGEKDRITNLSNSLEAFRALKALNKPVELIIYPREQHGIMREPNHEIDKMNRIFNWFSR